MTARMNTKAANKALESGIDAIYETNRNKGQICNDLMILTNSGHSLIGRIDRSLPEDKRIYGCKVMRVKGKTAYRICLDYIE